MTSRERVQYALEHQEPDRVPFDVGSGSSTSIVIEGYDNLKRHLGVSGETQVLNKAFRVARLDEAVLKRLGSDLRPLAVRTPSRWTPPPSAPGTFVDMWGVTWKQAFYGPGYYWEPVGHPLAEASIDDLERYPWPDPLDPGFTAGLAEEARSLYEGTSYALVGDSGFKSFWELGYLLRGFVQMLTDVMTDPEFVSALLAKLLEINLAGTGRFLEVAGPYIQVFRAGDDLATQAGPLVSPAAFSRFLKPIYARYFGFVKSRTDAKIFFHSCGNVTSLIDDLAEVGVDALNPVQVSAMGDTAALKARYGSKMSFWGGIDTQQVLPYGSPADVQAEVRRRIRDLAPGGGVVLAPVHNIQPDVPPENILAMADAVREFGTYPLQDSA
ncbi:MAG: uroporphyrinogen decarboxylase family protein [Anaerolineae bacterium]|nr:uroporphyrinogen decarboxylase family protein [Anaerolineae bacterium]